MAQARKFILTDSSVLVSYIVEEDANHKIAVDFIENVDSDTYIILPPLCVYEISVTLSKNGTKEDIIESRIGDLLKSLRVIVAQLNDLQFFKNINILSTGKNIGTHDFYILQTAIQFDIPIYTFDKKFVAHSVGVYGKIALLE